MAAELRPLLTDASAVKAMEYLRGDFANSDAIGPSRAAEFLYGRPDAAIQADAAGFVRQLLAASKSEDLLGHPGSSKEGNEPTTSVRTSSLTLFLPPPLEYQKA